MGNLLFTPFNKSSSLALGTLAHKLSEKEKKKRQEKERFYVISELASWTRAVWFCD